MTVCERCHSQNPDGFRFCGNCGARLGPEDATETARKVVTALFCDVVGSTSLGETLDPEALREVLGRYVGDVSATIARHGGTVRNFAGDAVLAVFGIPRVHEDDALRAVRAAVEINQRLPMIAEEVGLAIRLRTGLNTGLVITDEGRNLVLGDPVNVAARLEQAAKPGEILLGAETFRLVRDAVDVEPLSPLLLRGKAEPVAAYRLLRVEKWAPGVARRLDMPLVDRDHELAEAREAWARTVQESRCHILTLLGAAGVGKSRLAKELFATLGEAARVLGGRCLPYGDGITFWPLIEALTDVGDAADDVIRHLSEGGAGIAEELFLEVRRLLEKLALERPVILLVDDLQWAEPMLVDLLRYLVELAQDTPLLILCTARTDLLDSHPDWSERGSSSTVIGLDPLGPTDCEQLVDQLSPGLDADARAKVISASEGNPLFAEEIVAAAEERGAVELPPTIQSLLAARIERLGPIERELLTVGAVEGEVFHRSAVKALAVAASAADLDTQLLDLVRKDLIRPHAADVPGDEAFRFRHLLFRDVAYERLPRARRADLHERYADWLERHSSHLPEHEELAGWHLEQAVQDRELAHRRVDSATAIRAAEHLRAAARRADDRSDLAASRKLFERALSLVPGGDPLAGELTALLAERLVELGDLARADELLTQAEREHPDDPSLSLSRLQWMVHIQPEESRQIYQATASRMAQELAAAGDEQGLASLHMLGFWMEWSSSHALPAAEQVRLAAEHARAAGDVARRSRALGWYVATLIFGPADVHTIESELETIERAKPGPYLQSFVDLGHGEVQRLRSQFELAASLTLRAREGFRSLGLSTMAATCEQSLGWIELSAGRPAEARDALLRSDAILAELGERGSRSTTQALLSRASEQLGLQDAAREAIRQAEELSSPSDLVNFAITHEVQARLELRAGEEEAAERFARSALQHALQTDFVTYQARARLSLAEILSDCGRVPEARSEAEAAGQLFRDKGDQGGAEEVDALLEVMRV